jgi:DNA-binding CsgD family transcriptional regulator
MQGVDEQKKTSKVKLYIHQLNEQSGKSYWKFLRIKFNGKVMPIKKMNFDSPSEGIIDVYEKLKSEFVLGLTKEFVEELEQIDRDNIRKEGRNNLTDIEFEVLKMIQEGKSVKEIAQIREKGLRTIYECMERIKNKGFDVKKGHIRLENEVFAAPNPIPKAF